MIESGTIAAVVPIAVPTTNLVNGIKKTTSNKNGNERVILTSKFTTEKIIRFSATCPFLHKKRMVPTGNPTSTAAIIDAPTIKNVSPIDCQISAWYVTSTSGIKLNHHPLAHPRIAAHSGPFA